MIHDDVIETRHFWQDERVSVVDVTRSRHAQAHSAQSARKHLYRTYMLVECSSLATLALRNAKPTYHVGANTKKG
jgi:hypothetical protein